MNKIFLLTIILLSSCASQSALTPEEEAIFMSNLYLCKDVLGNSPTEIKKKEVKKRDLNCKAIVDKEKNVEREKQEQERKKEQQKQQKIETDIAMMQKRPQVITFADKVLADSIDQYIIIFNANGSYLDQCVQAGMVKAAALQAKNQFFYNYWNTKHRSICALAGVSY